LGLKASDLGYYIMGPEGATDVKEFVVEPPKAELDNPDILDCN
jgi:hypothetical protein